MTSSSLRPWLLALGLSTAGPAAGAQEQYTTYEDAARAGAKLVRAGDLAAARAPLEAALKLATSDRDKLDAHRALLVPYRELQDVEPMRTSAEYIISHTDRAAERTLTRGAVLAFVHKRGKMSDAVKGYEERLKKAPEDRTVLYLLAEAYAAYQKDPARAVDAGERLAAVETKLGKKAEVADQAHLAQQYVRAGKPARAAEVFDAIAPLDPVLEAWHSKEAAAAWLAAGDKVKALAAARRSAAAGTPEKRTEILTHFWHRGLGDVFLGAGAPREAAAQYERAIATTKIEGYIKECKAKRAQAEAATKD